MSTKETEGRECKCGTMLCSYNGDKDNRCFSCQDGGQESFLYSPKYPPTSLRGRTWGGGFMKVYGKEKGYF